MKAIVGKAPLSQSAKALILDKKSGAELLRFSMSTKASGGVKTFTAGGKTFSTDKPVAMARRIKR